jgi:tetratricopeptide (TPR) repeat protein
MPAVFVSYSHDCPEHSARVLALAQALRGQGIQVELDQFHQDEILDWPRWCNEQTSRDESDFVLCVATAEYHRRIEGRVPPEKGKGVHWEGSLLDDDLYDEKGNSRLIPVLFDDEPEDSIPRFLRGWTFCRLRGFSLDDGGYEHLLRILTGQARVVKNPLGTIPALPPEGLAEAQPPRIAAPRLRHGAERLFGRDEELRRLDRAWRGTKKAKLNVISIVAWGGVGKTSLVVEWMNRLSRDGWRGAERVFDWTFYSQGTREHGSASGDVFVGEALRFFGDPAMADSPTSAWDKGARLAQLVAQQRTLLVLDGLEPLQQAPGRGLKAGEIKDPAVQTLLKGLARHNPGLCLVTTRQPMSDLAAFHSTTAEEWDLEHLAEEAGAALLKSRLEPERPKGTLPVPSTEAERREISRAVGGHALTLHLLGGYIHAALGDVRRWCEVKFDRADDAVQGGHAFRVMAAYERWLGGEAEEGREGERETERRKDAKVQLAVLRVMGLFDRAADAGCLGAVRRGPAIEGLTGPLVGLDQADWNLAVGQLAELGLMKIEASPGDGIEAAALDSHPLVREYFGKRLREENPGAWQAAHRRLYEHLTSTTERWPDTLDGLQPLYQAVAHGCLAGLHQQARADVYLDRILRGTGSGGFYSTKTLGAIGADLGAVACFFEKPWTVLSPNLAPAVQAWLLNAAAFRLRALGRLTEAVEPMRVGMDRRVDQKDWKNAAISASNLSELELMRGAVSAAVAAGEQSVTYADRSEDAFQRMVNRTTLADALHQAGRPDDARRLFEQAEAMQAERQPEYPRLYSLGGFRYCDFLLSAVERAAWCAVGRPFQADTSSDCPPGATDTFLPASESTGGQAARGTQRKQEPAGGHADENGSAAKESGDKSPHSKTCDAVIERATQTLTWAERNRLSLLGIALDHLTLGRAALYRALLHVGESLRDSHGVSAPPDYAEAGRHLAAAVDGLRAAGHLDFLPHGLLTRAWLRFVGGDAIESRADLDEAWEIAERGPMPLHMADIHLTRARLFHAAKPYPWQDPCADLAAARRLIEEHGYHRRDGELADASPCPPCPPS